MLAQMQVPRMVNEKTNMQAALPQIVVSGLLDNLELGIDTFRVLALLIILIAAISVFFSLLSALKERRYELAILRTIGARPYQLMLLLLFEAIWVSGMGFLVGAVFSRIIGLVFGGLLSENYHYSASLLHLEILDLWLFIAAILVGISAAIIPAIGAMRVNISKTLSAD